MGQFDALNVSFEKEFACSEGTAQKNKVFH